MDMPDWLLWLAAGAALLSLILPAYFIGPWEDRRDWRQRRCPSPPSTTWP